MELTHAPYKDTLYPPHVRVIERRQNTNILALTPYALLCVAMPPPGLI